MYNRIRTSYYTDKNHTDIYPYSVYTSRNGCQLVKFMDIKKNSRGRYRDTEISIIRDIVKQFGDVIQAVSDISNCQIGESTIIRDNNRWSIENNKRDFKIKTEYNGYECNLFLRPKKFKLHLEYYDTKYDEFKDIKPGIYDITLYEKLNIIFTWRTGQVKVIHYPIVSNTIYEPHSITIYEKEFNNDKISAIELYNDLYEHYKQEVLPDIANFVF